MPGFQFALAFFLCSFSISAQQVITTLAGTEWLFPQGERRAVDAPIGGVLWMSVASDKRGNYYIADSDSRMIFKVNSEGILSQFAGNGINFYSGDGGPAVDAALSIPVGVAADGIGNVYIAEYGDRIRKVTPDGNITTIAGTGEAGFSGDGGPATRAQLQGPYSIAIDASGTLYFTDRGNHRIRKITPDGIITTIAGTGQPGHSGDGGPAIQATLNDPVGIAVDPAGNIYFTDTGNYRVRMISPSGIITNFAGGGFLAEGVPAELVAMFPVGVATDEFGNVFVADWLYHRVAIIGPDRIVRTVAGTGEQGFSGDGGISLFAQLDSPTSFAFDTDGSLFIADRGIARVRRVSAADLVIRTVAGNGLFRTGGDGGPATGAVLYLPAGVATDAQGNVYFAEQLRNRVRRVDRNGVITRFAGTGENGFGGDGGPATGALLSGPTGVAADALGNVYITEMFTNRIRRVAPDGVITTIAGTGLPGVAGNGGPAAQAEVHDPRYITVDSAGNIYFTEMFGHRVRRIDANGVITIVAGTGRAGFSGDGGAAINAELNEPLGVAVDRQGNLYISDTKNERIRRIGRDGIITTVAGTGASGFSGAGGPALQATFDLPAGLALDPEGNLYVADQRNRRVRKINPSGLISTHAGSGEPGYTGDGGTATEAAIAAPTALAFDQLGNLFIADWFNNRIRVVLAERPRFDAGPQILEFQAKSGGLPAPAQAIQAAGSIPGLLVSISSSSADWLVIPARTAATPATVQVSADPGDLAPGTYEESVVLAAPNANPPSRSVQVRFTVEPAEPPRLTVQPGSLTLSLSQGGLPVTESFIVSNEGGGTLNFSVAITGAGSWLSVARDRESATPRSPASIRVTVDPREMTPGTYSARIAVQGADTDTVTVIPLTVAVSAAVQSIFLPHAGLTFIAVAGGGRVPSQSFAVQNSGQGVLTWRTRPVTLSGGREWLQVSLDQGASRAGASDSPIVDVFVDSSGLAPGEYYGRIEVVAEGADNSPQFVAIVLQVLREGADPGPVVQPAGLVFRAVEGGISPGAQYVFVSNLTPQAVSFSSGRLTLNGRAWFEHLPLEATATPDRAVRIVVQPNVDGLEAGVHRGSLTLLFSGGVRRTVEILLVVIPPAPGDSAKSRRRAVDACVPTRLVPVSTGLSNGLQVRMGWPQRLEVVVVDDCGSLMSTGTVVASFSNGDPPIALASLRDGRWGGTWQARRSGAQVTVAVNAEQPERGLRGAVSLTVGLQESQGAPQFRAGAVVNSASMQPELPVAPGSLVSIFGSGLAENDASSPSTPWAVELGGTLVALAGRPLPLLDVSGDRINAVIPFDVPVNTRHQIIVQRGVSTTVPQAVVVASAQPAIYTRDRTGTGQGMIHVVSDDGSHVLADAEAPAVAGNTIAITCTGLGAVDPTVEAGAAAPDVPRAGTVNLVALTIGGIEAPVTFAGLVPGATGLYEVRARVPEGVEPGDAVQVIITVAGQSSPPVGMAVR